ncbi:hypothetical protein LI82_00625 [Methanococcoides methylutens]|uniref:DUF3303 domain-containing protein n=1 Tax=Methanococcoides methylutens TaxID=2226 RepID=A0A099T3U7_METMT|nr:DUF3303 family protein [Methanococcoides methylutens]KGK99752.1 hypothetical protein LI82_00625 [Methanococcoides methylutens]
MLFMDIITFDSKDINEVRERFENWEYPEGITIIGEWDDLSSCRHIVLYDVENSEAYAAGMFPWLDICRFDSFPVMASSDVAKFVSEHMGYNPVV